MNMKYYKIRNKNNPTLFRKADGYWNKSGKVYDSLGKLRTLLTTTLRYNKGIPADWEIVTFEVTEISVDEPFKLMQKERIFEMVKISEPKEI